MILELFADNCAQWFPVESSATQHMLSQLTKTIKLALKTSEQERAILRARSAVQRFPVVEWRQRLEDFQRRSITISRSIAGANAWGYDMTGHTDGGAGGFYQQDPGSQQSLAAGQWGRSATPDSTAPNSPAVGSRRLSQASLVGSPGAERTSYFENNNTNPSNGNLSPGMGKRAGDRTSAESFYDEDPNAQPLYFDQNNGNGGDKRHSRPKFFQGGYDDEDAPSSQGSSDHGESTVVGSQNGREPGAPQAYDNFLAAANRQFAKSSGGRNAPDPYFDPRASQSSENMAPSRPFTVHSRVSSFDSISSIVDEKNNSPLNKAMDTFTDSDGEVAQNFVQKLRDLTAGNSMGDMCIEKFLVKSEKAFFEEVKKEKISAMSVRSRDSFIHSRPQSMMDGFRPECESSHSAFTVSYSLPCSLPQSFLSSLPNMFTRLRTDPPQRSHPDPTRSRLTPCPTMLTIKQWQMTDTAPACTKKEERIRST